jgi:hypothetical protein
MAMAVSGAAWADRQTIAPGGGSQASAAVDAGANGICDTAARRDDFQALPVGQGTPFAVAIECGPDATANTTAAGDDQQLIPVGATCPGPRANVIDTGGNGVAESLATGDDAQRLPIGTSVANAPCIRTGANGRADTPDPVGGDDVRLIAVGAAEPNTPVIRCGANQIAETFANNVRGGDDVQRIAVGSGCPGPQAIVVDAGANGIAETRAQGAELVVGAVRALDLTIPRRRNSVSRVVKVVVANREFGTNPPAARIVTLTADEGSCPGGIVRQIDADARTPGVQATASVPVGRHVKGAVLLTFEVADVTSVARSVPFRCQMTVTAVAVDTAPAADDASNPSNNTARVEVEVVDRNDL